MAIPIFFLPACFLIARVKTPNWILKCLWQHSFLRCTTIPFLSGQIWALTFGSEKKNIIIDLHNIHVQDQDDF